MKMNKKNGSGDRIDVIEERMKRIEKEEKRIEKEGQKVEKKIDAIAKEEQNIEKIVVKLGKLSFRKKHLLELIRAGAGAFLGVGIGRGLIGLDSVARDLAWTNVIGILIFILGISALLIYKDEKEDIKNKGKLILFRRLIFIYIISIIIELISLLLFNVHYDSIETLLKIIIVGSYTAMASAITFSLAK